MALTIAGLHALEILDSRGNPALAVRATLSNGVASWAHVPSGASTGTHEALELRDGDHARFQGRGVLRAVSHVEQDLNRELSGFPAGDQAALDRRMIELDGTPNKSRLGANAILGVSCAVARARAITDRTPLWQSFALDPLLPVPMVNILSGGLHAGKNFEFQDFLALPCGFESYSQALAACVAIHGRTRQIVEERGYVLTGVADEGGWGPRLKTNEAALEILTQAIERAGFRPRDQVGIAIDAASTHFFHGGKYHLASENRALSSQEMIELLESWCDRYPVLSIEDGLAEDDWSGWTAFTRRCGSRLQLVGDDLFTTNGARLRRGIQQGAANCVLVKMNQIGTITETFDVVRAAKQAGYRTVISARSGETEDDFLADLAVASGCGQIKVGSITRSERLAKYNRLLEIEKFSRLPYATFTG